MYHKVLVLLVRFLQLTCCAQKTILSCPKTHNLQSGQKY